MMFQRLKAGGFVATASAVLGACAPQHYSPEAYELANIRPSNIVPKSSPRQLTQSLERFCLAGSPAAARKALRSAGYVKTPNRGQTEIYVVDTRYPAVQLGPDACAVVAEAKTGQSNAVEDFVARTFPDAKPLRTDKPSVEGAWYDAENKLRITMVRQGTLTQPARLMILVQRVPDTQGA